jgi:DNA repair photolyase
MKIVHEEASSILSPQDTGFLSGGFTHTLNAYNGCGFGATSCGQYCYAQFAANWNYGMGNSTKWGHGIMVKHNAAKLLREELSRMRPERRQKLRIFMSSVTDPYQPLESKEHLTRRLLEVFAEFHDLGLLVIQTRSNLILEDMPIIQKIPYAWVSMTIETDYQDLLRDISPGGISIKQRLETVKKLRQHSIPVQIAVSPCLPYSSDFPATLLKTTANRVIVDSLVDGDGARGGRTARSPFALKADMLKEKHGWDWRNSDHAHILYAILNQSPSITTGWSDEGFGGIESQVFLKQKSMF